MGMNANLKNGSMALVLATICVSTLAGCATFGGGEENPLVGTWNLTLDWGGGETSQKLVVNSDLTGTIEDSEAGWTSSLSDVKVEGNAVSFDFLYSGPGGYDTTFEGTITGAGIEGDISIGGKSATVYGVRN